ncbi:MAG: DNA alkylation repair protein [Candidatus Nanoarchaeia archaeon]
MNTPSLQDFETQFKQHPISTLKDCSSQDYQESTYTMLCYRANDIKSFQYMPYSNIENQSKLEFLNSLIVHSTISEVVTWALYEVELFEISELITQKKMLINWSYQIENWWHCDQLSSIYNKVLSSKRIFFKDLLAMSNFSSLWQRRLSLTSLYYYAKQCSNPLPLDMTLPLVEKLLLDEEYYVQKGVGWTLREMSQIDYDKTLDFLKIHTKHLSSASFSAAIEKLNAEDKLYIKELRKTQNSNPHEFQAHESHEINYHHLKHHNRN